MGPKRKLPLPPPPSSSGGSNITVAAPIGGPIPKTELPKGAAQSLPGLGKPSCSPSSVGTYQRGCHDDVSNESPSALQLSSPSFAIMGSTFDKDDVKANSGCDGKSTEQLRLVLEEAIASPCFGNISSNSSNNSFSDTLDILDVGGVLRPRKDMDCEIPGADCSINASDLRIQVPCASPGLCSTTASVPSPSFQLRPRSASGPVGSGLHLDLSCLMGGSGRTQNVWYQRQRMESDAALPAVGEALPTSSVLPSMKQSHQTDHKKPKIAASKHRPLVEPPPWAVEAKGEARFEPVCESLGVQDPIDLTSKACFRIGRSPASEILLKHATASRRHALLFHHPNGSCYVVDCGSAHGTYVNGVRVKSASFRGNSLTDSSKRGMVIPHRVRRGALVRFGGPGAPCYVLKSFSVGFDTLVKELGADAQSSEYSSGTLLSAYDRSFASDVTKRLCGEFLPKANAAGVEVGHEGVLKTEGETQVDLTESPVALVQINTRLNALGGTSYLCPEGLRLARNASVKLVERIMDQASARSSGKRTPERVSKTYSEEMRPTKRMRPCIDDVNVDANIVNSPNPAIISPVASARSVMSSPPLTAETPMRPIIALPLSASLKSGDSKALSRRVKFSADSPALCWPASITPDELSTTSSFESQESTDTAKRMKDPKTPRGVALSQQ